MDLVGGEEDLEFDIFDFSDSGPISTDNPKNNSFEG